MAAFPTVRLYGRVLAQAKPYWFHILGFFLLSLLATPLALLAPVPLKIAVDAFLEGDPLPGFLAAVVPVKWTADLSAMIFLAAGMVVVIAVANSLQDLAHSMLKTYTGERLVLGFRSLLFRHVQRLSLAYHDSKGSGDATYRIQYDAPAAQSLVIESLIPLVSAAFMLFGMIYVTFRINAKLAMVALLICPLLLLVTWTFGTRIKRRWREVKDLESNAQSVVQEVLGAVRVVKAFRTEQRELGRFETESRHGLTARLKVAFHEHCISLLIGVILACGTAIVLFVGMRDVRAGLLSVGELLIVMGYLKQLYAPLKTLGKQVTKKQRALASAERAFALLDELPEVKERPNARALARAAGAVSLRDVSFAYDDGVPVLQGVCFDVAPGTRVGIMGQTGAGKTTVMNLLMRFYDPTGGEILLDGVDIREYRLDDLRDQFGVVLQDPVLLSATIAENIAYGRPAATEEQVIEAAKAANAHDFILRFPEGYQTLVGERGMRLSGGERQRISLARAFLKDAPILILDEPTSSVDTRTEQIIMEAMERLMEGRTTFMIAHRLSTLEQCDVLLSLSDRRVVDLTAQTSSIGEAIALATGELQPAGHDEGNGA